MKSLFVNNVIILSCFLLLLPLLSVGSVNKSEKADSLVSVLSSLDGEDRFDVLLEISDLYSTIDENKSRKYANMALQMGKTENDPDMTANGYNYIANSYFYSGDFEKALNYYNHSISLKDKVDNPKTISNAYNNGGVTHRTLGNYDEAIAYFFEALNICEKTGDEMQVINLYSNIGGVYYYQDDNDKAIEYFEKVLEMRRERKNSIGIGGTLNNIGSIYNEAGQYDKALKNYKRAYDIYSGIGEEYVVAKILNNIGRVYTQKEQYRKALEYYEKSLKSSMKSSSKRGIANSLHLIGDINYKLGNYNKAITNFNKSLEYCKKSGIKPEMKANYKSLKETYYAKGDYKKAYQYFEKYSVIKDSILNEKTQKQVAEIQAKYESEKKQNEIKELNKEKKEQALEIARQKNELLENNIIRNYFIAGIGILVILVFFVFRGYYAKKKTAIALGDKNRAIELKNRIIEDKNNAITDSIRYAKRIQSALLPGKGDLQEMFEESFIFYLPKDIVSGDFYWLHETPEKKIFAVGDCTGHGVPGAFMSFVGIHHLNQAVKENKLSDPSEILEFLDQGVNDTLKQKYGESVVRDGMDMMICCLDKTNGDKPNLEFSGANNPLYIIRDNQIIEHKGNKSPIGSFIDQQKTQDKFSSQTVELHKGDNIYLFTDGYADQFGGPNGKKFKYSRFKELLLSIHQKTASEQGKEMALALNNWKGELEQLDDVCVMGLKIV